MIHQRFDLKLADGKIVSWVGSSATGNLEEAALDASRRYVDMHRQAAVIATRRQSGRGMHVLGNGRITG